MATQIDLYLGFYPQDTAPLDDFNAQIEPGIRMGLHPEGLFVFAAASVDELSRVNYGGFAEYTATGIVCGDCSDARRTTIRHASVAHVRACADAQAEAAAQHAAEMYAEGAWLRWAEGGWDKTGAYSAELWERESHYV